MHILFGEQDQRICLGIRVAAEKLGGGILGRKAMGGHEHKTKSDDDVSVKLEHFE
jgi:hypothetical protein